MHTKFGQHCQKQHISAIQEPGSKYIGHITITVKTSRNSFKNIFLYLYERNISLDKVVAIECDGTFINTVLKKKKKRDF